MNIFQKLEHYLTIDNLLKNLLIPITLLILYSFSFSFISSHFQLEGVNYIFTTRLWNYLLPLWIITLILIIVIYLIKRDFGSFNKDPNDKVLLSHLPLLLLPLTPIAQYLINNQDILSMMDLLLLVVYSVVISSVFIFVIPALFTKINSARILMSLSLAFVFSIFNMASLSQNFGWFMKGSLKIQLVYFAFVFFLSWILLKINKKTFLYIALLVYLVSNSLIQFTSNDSSVDLSSLPTTNSNLVSMVAEKSPKRYPNIYLHVYDSYVTNETMLGYGIDNSSQGAYLIDEGFVLYPHIYSVNGATVTTMSLVFNASTEFFGNIRRGVSGDGVVHHILRYNGYKTYGIFPHDFMFRGIPSSYDYSFPPISSPLNHILSAILLGEFRFDIGFDDIEYEEFVDRKLDVTRNVADNRIFVYSHTHYPGHSQNSGTCHPNEIELFENKLHIANSEMRKDIETINQYDPEAIVIIAGDHGPYLTKNCDGLLGTQGTYDVSEITRLDIQDRFGTFLAIRWPTEEYKLYDDIVVLQDLFPVIFSYLYDDPAFLELKIRPNIIISQLVSGATVKNGIIFGGINDGEPLYLSE